MIDWPVASATEGFGRRDDQRRNDRGGAAGGNDKKVGKICLQEVLVDKDGAEKHITHVLLHPEGTFAISWMGSEVGSWI